jgi:hypothetical protein
MSASDGIAEDDEAFVSDDAALVEEGGKTGGDDSL